MATKKRSKKSSTLNTSILIGVIILFLGLGIGSWVGRVTVPPPPPPPKGVTLEDCINRMNKLQAPPTFTGYVCEGRVPQQN